jgi:hypothetical protein
MCLYARARRQPLHQHGRDCLNRTSDFMPPGVLYSIGPIPIRLTECLGIELWGWESVDAAQRVLATPLTPLQLPHGELSYVSSN